MDQIKSALEQFCYNGVKYSKVYSPVTFSPFGAILAVIVLSYAMRVLCLFLMLGSGDAQQNKNPREDLPKKGSAAGRALSAHYNGLETTIAFSAAVFAAVLAEYPRRKLEDLCTLYVLLRVAFSVYYVLFSGMNEAFAYIRSAIFFMGQAVIYLLFVEAAQKKFGYVYLTRMQP